MVDRMITKNIFGCINFIIVSDHGMADHKRAIDLENFIPDLKKSAITFHGTLTSVRPMNNTKGWFTCDPIILDHSIRFAPLS